MARPPLPTPGVSTNWGPTVNAAVNTLSDTIDTLQSNKADLTSGKLSPGQVPALTSAALTDFTEAAQDVIGAMVTAAGGTYNDTANTISLPGAIAGGVVYQAATDASRRVVPAGYLLIIVGGSTPPSWMQTGDVQLATT